MGAFSGRLAAATGSWSHSPLRGAMPMRTSRIVCVSSSQDLSMESSGPLARAASHQRTPSDARPVMVQNLRNVPASHAARVGWRSMRVRSASRVSSTIDASLGFSGSL